MDPDTGTLSGIVLYCIVYSDLMLSILLLFLHKITWDFHNIQLALNFWFAISIDCHAGSIPSVWPESFWWAPLATYMSWCMQYNPKAYLIDGFLSLISPFLISQNAQKSCQPIQCNHHVSAIDSHCLVLYCFQCLAESDAAKSFSSSAENVLTASLRFCLRGLIEFAWYKLLPFPIEARLINEYLLLLL